MSRGLSQDRYVEFPKLKRKDLDPGPDPDPLCRISHRTPEHHIPLGGWDHELTVHPEAKARVRGPVGKELCERNMTRYVKTRGTSALYYIA